MINQSRKQFRFILHIRYDKYVYTVVASIWSIDKPSNRIGNLQSPTATILWITGFAFSSTRIPPDKERYESVKLFISTERRSTNFLAAVVTSFWLFVPANTIFPDLKINAVHFGSRILTMRAPKR